MRPFPKDATKEEAEAWEKEQDNANDITKVNGRIKNLAREEVRTNLTPVGDALCNMYTHHIMKLLRFADKITDESTKESYLAMIRDEEAMPARFMKTTVPPKKKP